MKERPILFSAQMVRAILAGTKTQTRRLLGVEPHPAVLRWQVDSEFRAVAIAHSERVIDQYITTFPHARVLCRYGKPGDRLWVRETFVVGYEHCPGHYTVIPFNGCEQHRRAFYRATDDDAPHEPKRTWKPAIHMPRWASRITLEITDVRVQRLQEISVEDCIAEGLTTYLRGSEACDWLRDGYARLWDSINAERAPWSSNPWVWAITFKRD